MLLDVANDKEGPAEPTDQVQPPKPADPLAVPHREEAWPKATPLFFSMVPGPLRVVQ